MCVDVAKQIQTHKLDILPLEKYQKRKMKKNEEKEKDYYGE